MHLPGPSAYAVMATTRIEAAVRLFQEVPADHHFVLMFESANLGSEHTAGAQNLTVLARLPT